MTVSSVNGGRQFYLCCGPRLQLAQGLDARALAQALHALDLFHDLARTGDQKGFKQDIVADVAAAAEVDVKYIKIQELRAGGVIVDLFIAPEVGETHKVLQDLRSRPTPRAPV